ncbi:hypothetical protein V2W23_14290, partial [Staphylococcus gallinarum]|uniref:hypothetical protein n=1 Tax=Staphylococcus gallinarum TaxID=1293 RepID=UPI00316F2643
EIHQDFDVDSRRYGHGDRQQHSKCRSCPLFGEQSGLYLCWSPYDCVADCADVSQSARLDDDRIGAMDRIAIFRAAM